MTPLERRPLARRHDTFCDGTGQSALLAAAGTAKTASSELRRCAIPHPLARMLRLTHAGSAFTIEHPDRQ